jgi:hypothetical protein
MTHFALARSEKFLPLFALLALPLRPGTIHAIPQPEKAAANRAGHHPLRGAAG